MPVFRVTVTGLEGSRSRTYKVIARDRRAAETEARRRHQLDGGPVRQRSRARSSGTEVEIIDTTHPRSPVMPYDGGSSEDARWMLTCVTHGTYIMCMTLREARLHASCPQEWCGDCAALTGQ